MARSSNTERAQRINAAILLLKEHGSSARAAVAMVDQYGISRRQAYRYIHEAQKTGNIPVPDAKIAFTVKLSPKLIRRLRNYAKISSQTLSQIVTQAIEAFLYKGRGRG